MLSNCKFNEQEGRKEGRRLESGVANHFRRWLQPRPSRLLFAMRAAAPGISWSLSAPFGSGLAHDFLRPVECSCRDAVGSESRLSEVMPLPRPHSRQAASRVLRHVRKAKAPRGSGARRSTAPAEPSPLQVCQPSAATSVIPGKKGCDRPDRQARQTGQTGHRVVRNSTLF